MNCVSFDESETLDSLGCASLHRDSLPTEQVTMDKLRIRMIGREDRSGNEYFVSTTNVPVLVDLSKAVIHIFFTDEDEQGNVYAELVIQHHDPQRRSKTNDDGSSRRRRSSKSSDSNQSNDG